MSTDTLNDFFLWCTLLNILIFIVGFCAFKLFNKFVCKIHGTIFNIAPEKINFSAYLFFGFYKIIIVFFNVIPFLVLEYFL